MHIFGGLVLIWVIVCLKTSKYVFFFIIVAANCSQVGVLPMDESKVITKGRLGPGMMITVDLQNGEVSTPFPYLLSYC